MRDRNYYKLLNNVFVSDDDPTDLDKLDKICFTKTIKDSTQCVAEVYNIENNEHVEKFIKHVRDLYLGKPRYQHDCDCCEYLGQSFNYDLYFCGGEPTVILRYGDEGHEYCSGLNFASNRFQKHLMNNIDFDTMKKFHSYRLAAIWAVQRKLLASDWDESI
jgi:hypothetical protein